jgi:hypothetical protein
LTPFSFTDLFRIGGLRGNERGPKRGGIYCRPFAAASGGERMGGCAVGARSSAKEEAAGGCLGGDPGPQGNAPGVNDPGYSWRTGTESKRSD